MVLSPSPPTLFDLAVNAVELLLAIGGILVSVWIAVTQDRMLRRIERDVEERERHPKG